MVSLLSILHFESLDAYVFQTCVIIPSISLNQEVFLAFFFCYHTSYKGFRCLDPVSHRVFITRHARFNENVFPFSSSSMQPSSAISDFIVFHDPTSSHPVMSSTNSSTGHSSPSSVTSSMPCKLCSLDLLPSPSSSISEPLVPTP